MNQTVGGIIAAGRARLEADLAGHIDAGAGDGSTLTANTAALDRRKLVSSVASGVGTPTTSMRVLGFDLQLPVLTAPMGPLELIDRSGARAMAEGAARGGAASAVALTSAPVLEEAVTASCVALFQLYWWGDRGWVRSMILRAQRAGFAAVVITVDVPDYGTRWVDVQSGFDHHGQMALPNLVDAPPERAQRLSFQQALTFEDIAWAVEISPLPIVLKGVLSGSDARCAVNAGVDAIYVSNHGGRALAGQIGTMDALDDVVGEIGCELPIVVDGGFTTAEDVAKGLACGC